MSKTVKEFAIESLFSALADRTRLRLLSLMADGEVCVCFFVEVLQQSQPKISRHLAQPNKLLANMILVDRAHVFFPSSSSYW